MILRNLQCHCCSSDCFASFHSPQPHFFPVKVSWLLQKSWWKILGCCILPAQSAHCGSWWPVGGCRPTDVARNSSAGAPTGGPRWSGGQVVPPPSIQLPGGVFGSSGGTMGRHCSAVVKGHMLRMRGALRGHLRTTRARAAAASPRHASGPKDWPASLFLKRNRRILGG